LVVLVALSEHPARGANRAGLDLETLMWRTSPARVRFDFDGMEAVTEDVTKGVQTCYQVKESYHTK
jgi:hypothetical protein